MSRLNRCFSELKAAGRCALVPFVTAGDPEPGVTVELMHGLVAAGANVLELGVPFSDPMADGPVIQKASERALLHHTSLHDVLGMVKTFREQDGNTPVVLMGYLNPIERMGYDTFVEAAKEAGVDGVLTVDLPPEEAADFADKLKRAELSPIMLLAPTSDARRIDKICSQADGFVYYVSLKGVTGSKALDIDSVRDKLSEIRTHTDMPVGVGFGIKTPEDAATVAKFADAVVVGSMLVTQIEDLAIEDIVPTLSKSLAELRAAMDA